MSETSALNRDTREVTRGDRKIELTPKEFEILACLMERPGHVWSREKIMNRVWDFDYDGGSNVVDVYMHHLQEKDSTGARRRNSHRNGKGRRIQACLNVPGDENRMKHISITAKITLLYMTTLIIISAAFLAAMVYAGIREAGESARRVLMEEVTDASEEIGRSGTSFTVDSDLQYYHNGVYLSIFDENRELLEGRRPASLSSLPELKDKALRKVKDGQDRIWYVYDSRFDLDGNTIWVRGCVNDFAENNTLLSLLRFLIIGIPLLIIAAAVGGYFITKRAFRPVGKAVETAAEISRDGDLKRRLPALRGGDEVSRMTDAFNRMFDRLEKTVEDEKRFTNDAAHELRTPLAVIQSQSEYALEDESYQKHALEVINREAKTMSQMVNQLLMLARGDAGRLEVCR
jgi:signal transduction histidine kinase